MGSPDSMGFEFEPDWERLASSQLRREQEIPWLDQEIESATSDALASSDQVVLAERRGWINALRYVRNYPDVRVREIAEEAKAAQERREEDDKNARRARFGFRWVRRLLPDRPIRS